MHANQGARSVPAPRSPRMSARPCATKVSLTVEHANPAETTEYRASELERQIVLLDLGVAYPRPYVLHPAGRDLVHRRLYDPMPGNTFGELFRVTTAGVSHGPGYLCIIDGCPPGLPLSVDDLLPDLRRRRPGQSKTRHPTERRGRAGDLVGRL